MQGAWRACFESGIAYMKRWGTAQTHREASTTIRLDATGVHDSVVDLNEADEEALQAVPGVGHATVERLRSHTTTARP